MNTESALTGTICLSEAYVVAAESGLCLLSSSRVSSLLGVEILLTGRDSLGEQETEGTCLLEAQPGQCHSLKVHEKDHGTQ